jgi:hypothetical protein
MSSGVPIAALTSPLEGEVARASARVRGETLLSPGEHSSIKSQTQSCHPHPPLRGDFSRQGRGEFAQVQP